MCSLFTRSELDPGYIRSADLSSLGTRQMEPAPSDEFTASLSFLIFFFTQVSISILLSLLFVAFVLAFLREPWNKTFF